MTKYHNPAKVVTGVCRFSYANLWEAKAMDENSKPKYSVSLIIPKSDTKTIEKIRAAIQAAYEEGQGKLKGNSKSVPPLTSLKTPLRDGDLERPDDEAYVNSYFVNANSITAPGIVDAACQQILDHSEIYSGVYWQSQHHVLCVRYKDLSGHCLRFAERPEDSGWRTAGRSQPCRGRLRNRCGRRFLRLTHPCHGLGLGGKK